MFKAATLKYQERVSANLDVSPSQHFSKTVRESLSVYFSIYQIITINIPHGWCPR